MASVSPIVADPETSAAFYRDTLGLPLEGTHREYLFSERLAGVKHFGLWPLAQAARACFGLSEWPAGVSVPQASVEFEVANVAVAAQELADKGCQLLHGARIEPWGQQTARLSSPEGLLVAVCRTPWFHDQQPEESRANKRR